MKRKIFIHDYELVSKRRDWIDVLLLFETNEPGANVPATKAAPPPETNIWLVDCLYEIMSNQLIDSILPMNAIRMKFVPYQFSKH
jgi:hypothetical protein